MHLVLAIAIFVVTLVVVLWRPRGLSIGWTAVGGAALALLTRVVHLADVWTVTKIVWDATFAFIGIIVFSTILDRIGFFEWAALHMARMARGNGRRLFVYVTILGAVVSALFTNDGGALILTPIVLEKMKLLQFNRRGTVAFVLACGFIADSASLPLVVSNLVNIVSADYFHIGFVQYLIDMIAPYVVSVIVSLLMLLLVFWKSIPKTYHPTQLNRPGDAIHHRGMFITSWILLGVLSVGYIVTDLFHIPVSLMTGLIALAFLVASTKARLIRPWPVLKEAPWNIVFFSIGMYVVVYGLQNAGLTSILSRTIEGFQTHGALVATLSTGVLMAVVSSVMNNLPSVLVGSIAVHGVHAAQTLSELYVYANVIGNDLGPKMTPIGSLATLLWLHVLSRKGVHISVWMYCRIGLILTLPTLVLTLVGMYAWNALVI